MTASDIFIHPTSEVSKGARIGSGTKVWQHCTVLAGARIGKGCLLSQNVYIEGRTYIGNGVKIKNNVSIYEGVAVEDDVFIGPSVVFTNVVTPRSYWPRKNEFLKTLIKKGATIGANSTILCGSIIGRYAMVGLGSVVTRSLPDFAFAYGVPARQRGWVCYCGSPLDSATKNAVCRCGSCGSVYKMKDGLLTEWRRR